MEKSFSWDILRQMAAVKALLQTAGLLLKHFQGYSQRWLVQVVQVCNCQNLNVPRIDFGQVIAALH